MSPTAMEAAMELRALPDAERVVIRNRYQSLVCLGWPTQYITTNMRLDSNQDQFDTWVDCLTLVVCQTRRAQRELKNQIAIESSELPL